MDETQQFFYFHRNNHVNSFGNHYPARQRAQEHVLSYTCVVDLSEIEFAMAFPETLITTLRRNSTMSIAFGMSVCHPEDTFCYKTGRDLATARIRDTETKVIACEIENYGNKWHQMVILWLPEMDMTLTIRMASDARRPRIRFKHKSENDTAARLQDW
jgi:hypothetical protein